MTFISTSLPSKLVWAFLLLLPCAVNSAAADERAMVAGLPAAEALRLGEAMYRKGVLPSGKPLTAIVQGDMELTGEMSTCANCHLRSGLGALEGGILSPPTNGKILYAPLKNLNDIPGSTMKRSMFKGGRPAYTRESLATMLLTGVGPAGATLSETMPRYHLTADEMKILIFYLENLSSEISPGVTGNEIRFATIVSETDSPGDRDALLLPLHGFINVEWNTRLNELKARQATSPTGTANRSSAKNYRTLALDVWELTGTADTWHEQLEKLYRQKPVFAVLGGIAPGKWDPVHDFCEKNQLPCILPHTDLPVVSENDWYTLYYSKGYYQEGETAAKYLSRVVALPPEKKVIQIFRDSAEGTALARGFAETWEKLGNTDLVSRPVARGEKTGADFWKKLSAANADAVLLIWLGQADLGGIENIAAAGKTTSTIFVSSTLLAGELNAIPDAIRDMTFITWPTRLPGDGDYARSVANGWFKFKKIPVTNLAVASKSYFMTRILSRILVDMGDNLYRDYFLDIFDDGKDETNTSVLYPKLSFGPGQRYASKGCYVVTLTKGNNPKVLPQSDWVIY